MKTDKIEFQYLRAIDLKVENGTVSFEEQPVAVKVDGHKAVFFRNASGGLKKVTNLDEVREMASNSASRLLSALTA